ncbi:MAG TPA: hypothetical protein VFB54_15650 [Burkholderiales bacterium]|nr:hypothetical protein [Burkholderiales bacterium]
MASRRPARHLARHALLLLLSFTAGSAASAELGKATVRSRIGQPLDVDIEVLALKPGEDKTLTARLASRQTYGKAGLEYNRVLPLLRVTIARRSGRPLVRLRTAQTVSEPYLETLVELRSSAGSQTRRYTLLLEAPGVAQPKPAAKPPPKPQASAATVPKPGPELAPATPAAAEAVPEKPGGTSRDELFGLPPREGASATERQSKPLVEWRGFVQNTTAYDYHEPKHWSRAVVRTQLGTQGGSGDFKWKASARLDVDPVYFNSGFYPEPVRKDQRADFFLRETYVDTSLGGLQLRLGKQHIVWGEMVGLFFADVVSARDDRDFILPDFDIIRIPQWAARIEHFGENSHAELIWLPYPEINRIGKPGAEFYPFPVAPPPGFSQQFENEVGPQRTLRNSNIGGRVSTLRAGWDVSGFYYRSTDVNATFYRDVVLGPTPTLVFTPRHDRIWQTGGTLAKDFRSVVGKAEVIYTSGRRFNVTRLAEPDGVVPQRTLDYVLGLDFTLPRETRLNLQYFDRVFSDHDPDLVFDRRETGVSALLSEKVAGTLYPELFIVQSVTRNDRLTRWKLGWQASKDLRLTSGVDVFHGPPTAFFGRFDNRDRVYLEARYDF